MASVWWDVNEKDKAAIAELCRYVCLPLFAQLFVIADEGIFVDIGHGYSYHIQFHVSSVQK